MPPRNQLSPSNPGRPLKFLLHMYFSPSAGFWQGGGFGHLYGATSLFVLTYVEVGHIIIYRL